MQVGWKTIQDYYTFMWVPTPNSEELTKQQEVLFKGREKILSQPLEASRTIFVFVLNGLPLILY